MKYEHIVTFFNGIKDKIESVWNWVANPVRGGNDQDIHSLIRMVMGEDNDVCVVVDEE